MLKGLTNLGGVAGLSRAEMANASWLVGGTLLRLSIAAAVDIAVARYLSPDGFGRLRFSIAIMVLFGSLSGFGLGGLAVRDLVQYPEKREEILGTVLVMRFVMSIMLIPLAIGTSWAARPGDNDVLIMTSMLAGMSALGSMDSVDFLLQAELKSNYTVFARGSNLIVTSLAKVLLIVFGAPLWSFGLAYGLEFIMAAITFTMAYLRLGYSPRDLRFSMHRARGMMILIWPVFIAGAANTLNIRVDQVMLGAMREADEVGFYAAASRLSIIWLFLPDAIVTSAFPALVRARDQDTQAYGHRLQVLFSGLAWAGIVLAIVTTLISSTMIRLLYGSDFGRASDILIVQIWASPFIFMGTLFNRWLIAESRFGLTAVRHTLGATLNVVLNLILIPSHGAMGSAFASLVSYATASYFASFVYRPTWGTAAMMTRALIRGPADIIAAWRRG